MFIYEIWDKQTNKQTGTPLYRVAPQLKIKYCLETFDRFLEVQKMGVSPKIQDFDILPYSAPSWILG